MIFFLDYDPVQVPFPGAVPVKWLFRIGIIIIFAPTADPVQNRPDVLFAVVGQWNGRG